LAAKKKSSAKPKSGGTSTAGKKSSKTEPKTMGDLLSIYGDSGPSLSQGDKIKGTVIEITSKKVIIDIGAKGEGVVAEKAFAEAKDYIKTLNVGDSVTASVIIPETFDGLTILSLREAAQDASWEKIDKARNNDKPIVVVGITNRPAGLTVDVEGIIGFIPASQLGKVASKNPSALVGSPFKAIIIEADRSKNKVVLSEREVSDAESIEEIKEAMRKLSENDVYEGTVETIANFGCFVQIITPVNNKKIAIEGLVHISEMSWDKIVRPEDIVSEGDKVKVKVIDVNKGRLALSMKQAQKDPWEDALTKFKKDKKVTGKIIRQTDFGVFVQLEPGIEGLIHLTKIPPGHRLDKGDEVKVYIEEIDKKNKKISLGLVLTAKPVGYR
jgi:small subunit ribosomal protein S1